MILKLKAGTGWGGAVATGRGGAGRGAHSRLRLRSGAEIADLVGVAAESPLVTPGLDSLVAVFNSQLERFPLSTDILTAVFAHSVGNTVSQLSRRNGLLTFKALEWGQYCLFGVADGTMGHLWYHNIDRVIDTPNQSLCVAEKVFADISIYTPLYCFVFITFFAICEGLSSRDYGRSLGQKMRDIYTATIAMWLPIDCVLYGAVRASYRVLLACTALVAYSICLNNWNSDEPNEGEEESQILKKESS